MAFKLSWALLLFNLLPFYPLDGGQMLKGLLWFRYGQLQATLFAATFGLLRSDVPWAAFGSTTYCCWPSGSSPSCSAC